MAKEDGPREPMDAGERAPLLGNHVDLTPQQPASRENDGKWRYDIVIICAVMLILLECGLFVSLPARGQILEDIICRDLFPGSVDAGSVAAESGSPCRGPEVQGKITMLQGLAHTLDSVPGLLTAIPYGVAVDKFGRKPILILALLGQVLQMMSDIVVLAWPSVFPVELYIITPLFYFIGGGLTDSILYTIGADIVPPAKMAVVYLQIGATSYGGELIGAQIGGILTDKDPWLSMIVGFGIVILGSLFVFAIPETMHLRESSKAASGIEPSRLQISETRIAGEASDRSLNGPNKSVVREGFEQMWSMMAEALTFLYGNSHLMLLLFALVFSIVGKYVQSLLLQYAAKRYDITWGKASILVSLRGVFILIFQLAILPGVSWLLARKAGLDAVVKDLWMARAAVFGLLGGALLIAFSATAEMMIFSMVIFAFGYSFNFFVRSILNALVDEDLRGTLNATIGFCERVGVLIAVPIMSWAFKLGIGLGGNWIGLPFIFAACMFFVSTVVIWVFRLRPAEGGSRAQNLI